MPLFTIWLIFNSNSILALYYTHAFTAQGHDVVMRIYLVFLITTVLMPGVSFYILRRNNMVSSFAMPHRGERFFPYLTTLVYYVVLYYLLRAGKFPAVFLSATLGTIITLILILFINTRLKISAHAAGIAGVIAIYGVLLRQGWVTGEVEIFTGLVILAGLVCTARLSLNAHRHREIYLGLLVGFFSELLVMHYQITI